jgi:hypothetical protein
MSHPRGTRRPCWLTDPLQDDATLIVLAVD